MPHASAIFDRKRVRCHRDRIAASPEATDFLLREMADRLADRLDDTTRRFPLALDLGAHHGLLADYVQGKGGIETLVQSDMSEKMLLAIPSPAGGGLGRGHSCSDTISLCPPPGLPPTGGGVYKLVADEEFLPFAENSFDLVMSAGSLHWVNDLPGTLIQIRRILKPGGMFIAILPGGQTLRELRHSFEQAELALSGGLSPRISPFVDVKDGGSLLARAGFEMPVADSDLLTVSYPHPLKLMRELRQMGESNAMAHSRKGFTPCSLVMSAADHYLRDYSDENGRIPATFELVALAGWKPHAP